MNKYFEIINLEVPCLFTLGDGTRFDLRTGIPNRAPEVYKRGFRCLGLKPGAEELYKKETVEDLIAMVNRARRIEDVEILALCKPRNRKLQDAVEARKNQFVTK